jgi:flagella synthesis protein FlgN
MMIEKTYPFTEKLILDALLLAQELNLQLNLEADALKNTQHSDLIFNIAANKKQLVVKLEQFNSQLGQVLATENLPNSQQGLTDYFTLAKTANFSSTEVTKNWESIRTISAKSKILNEQNGASLELLARHTKRSLQILKGKSQFANTYGPDGAAKSESYARTLVLA